MGTDEMMEYFIKYPKSHKRVVSICEECGMVRESDFVRARALCISCAGTKRFSSIESREDVSTRQRAYWTPEHREKQSVLKTEFHRQHPEAGAEHSGRMKEYIRIHPEHTANLFRARAEYYADPLCCAEHSRQWYNYYEEHPEVRTKISETLKSSDAHKAISDMQRGGHDIVKHHFIYDRAHPDNHTVEMTRSEHTSHHHWMRRAGLEVPHINSEHRMYSEQSA